MFLLRCKMIYEHSLALLHAFHGKYKVSMLRMQFSGLYALFVTWQIVWNKILVQHQNLKFPAHKHCFHMVNSSQDIFIQKHSYLWFFKIAVSWVKCSVLWGKTEKYIIPTDSRINTEKWVFSWQREPPVCPQTHRWLRTLRDPPRVVYKKPPRDGCVVKYTTWGKLPVRTQGSVITCSVFSLSDESSVRQSLFTLYRK